MRALLTQAQDTGRLDEVEDQLFKVERLVAASPDLRATLGDRRTDLAARTDLPGGLLAGKVDAVTDQLARRAVGARRRTFELTPRGLPEDAADLRLGEAAATVEVARPFRRPVGPPADGALPAGRPRREGPRRRRPGRAGRRPGHLGDEVIEGTVAGRLHDARRRLA